MINTNNIMAQRIFQRRILDFLILGGYEGSKVELIDFF
jgi:hypothetical protein